MHNILGGTFWEQLYLANPITIAIIGAQRAGWGAGVDATGDLAQVWPEHLALRLAITLVVSLVLLIVGQRVFARLQGNFAQEL